jgi:hypothetical protein
MVNVTLRVRGTKEFQGKALRSSRLISTQFKPKLTKELARKGVAAIKRKLRPHKWTGGSLANVFAKSTPGGNAEIVIGGDAVWFEFGVRKHKVPLTSKNQPLQRWAMAHGKGDAGVLWVKTPRLNLTGRATAAMSRNFRDVAKREWNRIIK